MQITHKMVPWMPVGRKMQNVVFSKLHPNQIYPLFQKVRNIIMCLGNIISNFQYSFETHFYHMTSRQGVK